MKTKLNKTEAREKINNFFKKKSFIAEEIRKIKRLAMKFNIKLGEKRRLFCKKCLNKLKGRTRISKRYKIVECSNCNYKNKIKLF